MAIYFECSEDKGIREHLLRKRINEWIHSDAMKKILSSFNTCIPNNLSTEESVNWLLRFSDEWDYRKKQQTIVALGGARLSCLLRPRYAKKIWEQFGIKPRAIMMLSGARPIAESERSYG